MILFEIDAQRIARLPFESEPPRAIDRDRVAQRPGVQPMEPPPREAQIVENLGPMQRLEPRPDTLDKIGSDAARIVVEKEIAQRLAAEAANHGFNCKTLLDSLQAVREPVKRPIIAAARRQCPMSASPA